MTETLVLLAYRLGLGWLVGRRYVVITTTGSDSKATVHSVAEFEWNQGQIVVPIVDDQAPWVADIAERPVAMLQAAPGPLSVSAERRNGEFAFRPTGQPAPYPVESDLIWVIPVIALALAILRRLR